MLKQRKFLIAALILFLILASLAISPLINSIPRYLSETNRVSANILLIEGWLPPNTIETAYKELNDNSYDYVLTTGIRISGYFQVSMNGYLIFYPSDSLKTIGNSGYHNIAIDAFSEMGGENCAHFNVFINDSLVGDFYAGRKKKHYEVTWNAKLALIDSIMVQFDNDRFNENGDRNLYVKEIILDNVAHISYQHNSEYDIGELDGKRRLTNNFNSHAEVAKNTLLSLGIDSSLILAIPGKKVRINRTLSSALAFKDWLKTSNIEVKGINIVTEGTHARRTWMTYNKILNKSYEIGIISLTDFKELNSRKYKYLNTLREIIGLVYYWILLLPY